jgi:hypothetical protein
MNYSLKPKLRMMVRYMPFSAINDRTTRRPSCGTLGSWRSQNGEECAGVSPSLVWSHHPISYTPRWSSIAGRGALSK